MPWVKMVFFLPFFTRHHSALVAPLSQMSFIADMLFVAGYFLPVAGYLLMAIFSRFGDNPKLLLTLIYKDPETNTGNKHPKLFSILRSNYKVRGYYGE